MVIMKTKLEMAHEWAMQAIDTGYVCETGTLVIEAWQYADAMMVEADKRKPSGFPNVLRGACGEIVAVKVDDNTFIEREGQHFDDVANQKRTPKVSRFERSDAVKEVLNRAENMGLIKPKAVDEWQPDWSKKTNEELRMLVKTLDGIIESRSDCNHEWDHISTYGGNGNYYVCSCGAEKHPVDDF